MAAGAFIIGFVAMIGTPGIDRVMINSPMPSISVGLIEATLAGIAVALFTSIAVRVSQAANENTPGMYALWVTTLAFALFLLALALIGQQVPVQRLLYFYALATCMIWLMWRLVIVNQSFDLDQRHGVAADVFARHLNIYLKEMPHAPFIWVGLFLLGCTPFFLLANQLDAANETANWAYGFLFVGIAGVLIRSVHVPNRFSKWTDCFASAIPGIAIASLVGFATFFGLNPGVSPERTFIADVYPRYLEDRIKTRDILLSDSPSLRLRRVPKLAAFLDLSPDERGMALWDDLVRALQGWHRVYALSVQGKSGDTQEFLQTFLKANGCFVETVPAALPIRVYDLREPLVLPRVLPPKLAQRVSDAYDPVLVDWGAIQITSARFESRVCSHDAIAVAFRWRLGQPVPEPLKVSLVLLDSHGREIRTQDFFINDLSQHTTDQWQLNVAVPSYHLFVVPFGTPPGAYTVAAGVYSSVSGRRLSAQSVQGVSITPSGNVVLGQVQIERPEAVAADPYNTRDEAALSPARLELRPGLWLDAYNANVPPIIPGEPVNVTVRWRASVPLAESYLARVSLQRGDGVIADRMGIPVDGTYPTTRWAAGESVVDHWELTVPPATPGGIAHLELGTEGGKMLYVADAQIVPITRTFQIPPLAYRARATWPAIGDLVGYGLDRLQISSSDPLELDLYWRAGTSLPTAKDYVVFAQLLAADGHLVAQSDSQPARGQRPTRSWLPGEIITDHHILEFRDKDYRGTATLIVGFYDSETLARVAPAGGDDSYVLPSKFQITSNQ